MAQVTMEQAERLIKANVTEQHLFTHARAVSAAMGAMAEHFGEDKAHWEAVGYLHDVDYEKFPEEHLAYTRELLSGEDIDESDIRAILPTDTASARMLNRRRIWKRAFSPWTS